jgi:hypothetical protein
MRQLQPWGTSAVCLRKAPMWFPAPADVLAQIRGRVPAVNVFFEFGRSTCSFGQAPLTAFRLIDILHHARLENIEQVMECLEVINQALVQARKDESAKFCGFDSEGHCFVMLETQASIAKLWQSLLVDVLSNAAFE